MNKNKTTEALQDYIRYSRYARYIDKEERRETWKEQVDRVFRMHEKKYKPILDTNPEFTELFKQSYGDYLSQLFLGSQRILQFAGDVNNIDAACPIMKHQARVYNCVTTAIDRDRAFSETMYMLLCGCGVGFSVQEQHVINLPAIHPVDNTVVGYTIDDSIEGWACALGVLIASYFRQSHDDEYSAYYGKRVDFDFSLIRPKGAYITGGFKAPGPDGLRIALTKVKQVFENRLSSLDFSHDKFINKLRPIDCYDLIMHASDAVLSGGVRRSATICMFSKSDTQMLAAKTGNWFIDNPQRARSNNSVMLLRNSTSKEEFMELMKSVEQFGEPGFIWVDDLDTMYNPCVEIGMYPFLLNPEGTRKSGFQGCVTGSTKLITKYGITTIQENLGVPTEIWNGKNWSTVTPRITGENRDDFYRVSFSDGSFLDCTSNHKFICSTKDNKKWKESTTEELIPLIKLKPIRLPRSEVITDFRGEENRYAYEYGFILGDGTCTKNSIGNSIRTPWACLYERSKDLSLPLEGELKSVGNGKGGKFTRIYFNDVDREFSFDLKYNEGLPKELFSWSRESIIKFFAGWIDADGAQANSGFRIYGEENKMRDAQLLLTKLGINSSVNLHSPEGTKTNLTVRLKDLWYIQVANTEDLISFRLKLIPTKATGRNKFQLIESIEKLDIIEDSYCFDEPHLHQGLFGNVLTKQCNLCEINGKMVTTEELFYQACKSAAIVGTMQAGYTDFKYLTKSSKAIFELEALLGISITGFMDNPSILLDERILKNGAQIIVDTNEMIAKMIGINPAARTTCVKPAGSTSALLGTSSGCHGHHAKRYIRHTQVNKEEFGGQMYQLMNPAAVEESVWSSNKTDNVISFLIESNPDAILKEELLNSKQLDAVRLIQQNWVEPGTTVERCVSKTVRHNVSNTISVTDWTEVSNYIYDNRKFLAGISFISHSGDKDYPQAPFTEVLTTKEIIKKYGDGALFASGLIVDGLEAFDGKLWTAIDSAIRFSDPNFHSGLDLKGAIHDSVFNLELKISWCKRFKKFAKNYTKDNSQTCNYLLKDVYNLHKWNRISLDYSPINWDNMKAKESFTDIDTTSGLACAGPNGCEIK